MHFPWSAPILTSLCTDTPHAHLPLPPHPFGSAGVRTVAIGLPSLTRLQLFNCSELRHLELDCLHLERLSVQVG